MRSGRFFDHSDCHVPPSGGFFWGSQVVFLLNFRSYATCQFTYEKMLGRAIKRTWVNHYRSTTRAKSTENPMKKPTEWADSVGRSTSPKLATRLYLAFVGVFFVAGAGALTGVAGVAADVAALAAFAAFTGSAGVSCFALTARGLFRPPR